MRKIILFAVCAMMYTASAREIYGQKLTSSPKREYLLNDSVKVPYAMGLATVSLSGVTPFTAGSFSSTIDITAEYFILDKFTLGLNVDVNQNSTSVALMATAYAYDAFGFLPNFVVPYIHANIGVGSYYSSSNFPVYVKYGGGLGFNIMFAKFGGLKAEMGIYAHNLNVYPAPKIGMFLIF